MTRTSTSLTVLALAGLLTACGGGDAEAPAATDANSAAEETVSETTAEVAEAPATDAADVAEEEVAEAAPADEPAPAPAAKPAEVVAAKVERPAAFAICGACHKVEPGQHGIGPSLAGIYGTKAGDVPGFKFSPAMTESGLTWDDATLDRYLENPRAVVPGTIMSFAGEKNPEKRKALIEYIKSL